MAVLKDLLKIQAGKESTWGTPVTPTSQLAGITEFNVKPIVEVKQWGDLRGSLAPAHISALAKEGAEGNVDGIVLYQDFPYWLDSICGEATATGSYSYVYAAPNTAVPASPRKLTLIEGDGSNDWGIAGGLVSKLTIAGASNEELTFAAELIGKRVMSSGTSSALSDRTVTVAMGNDVSIYIDDFGGTVGATQITQTAFSFELELDAQRALVYHLGSLSPDNFREARWVGSLKLVLELTATTKAYFNSIIAASSVFKKLVRIKAANGSNQIVLDFAGTSTEAPELFTDEDGVVTLEVTLNGEFDTGAFANWFRAQVINSVSALP